MKPLTTVLLVICLILAGGWFFTARAHSATQERLEEIADEKAKLELQLAGYVSELAEERRGYLAMSDSAKALEDALRDSESRRYARTEIVVETRVDTVVVGTDEPRSQGVTADIAADPLYGTLRYVPPRTFGVNLVCRPRLEQYIVQSASDRLLIGVRALSPRTEVSIEAFNATPYLRTEGGSSLLTKLLWAIGGAAAWELAR